MTGRFMHKKGFRREEQLNEYSDLGNCLVEELSEKRALIRIGERRRTWIPYSLMHEEDMAKIDVGVRLDRLRVQAWFARKMKKIA